MSDDNCISDDVCMSDANESGVIDTEGFPKLLDFNFDVFALSETRFDFSETRSGLMVTPGIDGVIDKDFGKSGRFKLDPSSEPYLLLSDFVIEMDEIGCFVKVLDDFLLKLVCGLFGLALELGVVDVIVVVVIDNELLIKFCCRPIKVFALPPP